MNYKSLLILITLNCFACNSNTSAYKPGKIKPLDETKITGKDNPYDMIGAIPLPAGFSRTKTDSLEFADWLLHVKLKKDKTVHLFDGSLKTNQTAQFAVLDISVGNKNLQQCADAVMRLRAEYLYQQKKYDQIIFTDNEGNHYYFTPPYNRINFQHYLDKVFGMCGTASLSKQLKNIAEKDVQPGDVLIRGGFPGHAVIVMDAATNNAGKKIYLLAQSYMPAQDIHVLVNPKNNDLSPWYVADEAYYIETPEYTFTKNEWKHW